MIAEDTHTSAPEKATPATTSTAPSASAEAPPAGEVTSKWDDSEFHQRLQESWLSAHKREVIALSGLLGILVVVIFGLPSLINSEAQQQGQKTSPAAAVSSSTKSVAALNESPWEDAQLAKARRAAQEVLAKLLDKQKALESKQVRLWANTDFDAAMAQASSGDQLYRQRQFTEAQTHYRQALNAFDQLITQAGTLFDKTLLEGSAALDAQQLDRALNAYTLATAIRPNNQTAQQGLTRAQSLEQVMLHLEAASNRRLQQQLDTAKQEIEKALEIDPESKNAQRQLTQINSEINRRNYASAMGKGFDQLYQKQYVTAIKAFKQALALKPNDSAAQQALTQSRNQQTQASIEQHLTQASTLEKNEDWQSALQHYQAALSADKSLVSARIGGIRTQARLTLDQQLQKAIDRPLRLADEGALQQAKQLLNDAQAIKPRGQKIDEQVDQLQEVLTLAQQPISIVLRSDNSTQVTLYKVGKLGNFAEHQLQLKPGRYIAVGNRKGYRDVREEFVVKPDTANLIVVIQCLDKISLDG